MRLGQKLAAVFAVIAYTGQVPGDAPPAVSGESEWKKCGIVGRKCPESLIFAERALDCGAHAI